MYKKRPGRQSIGTIYNGTLRLMLSIEKPDQPASRYSDQNSRSTRRANRMWIIWNRVLGRKPPQRQDQPSTPDTGDRIVRYPVRGTRRIHLEWMERRKRRGLSDKLAEVTFVEYIDSEKHHVVKLKGLPIRSVHNCVEGFLVTTTKPEDAETLRKVLGFGDVLDCVLQWTSPVMPEENMPMVLGADCFESEQSRSRYVHVRCQECRAGYEAWEVV
ncbi:hypothetical protein B0T13DRAFT_479899 [Neurospora crassa]|nr:hypothetical protein B0T13DRAFT_479899 [Neurospora crassa]